MPMKRKQTCTMRDVATHLGISHATVSRALRNDPRITEAVRLSVVKAANKLGYKRDPRLAELMSHVRATKARALSGVAGEAFAARVALETASDGIKA